MISFAFDQVSLLSLEHFALFEILIPIKVDLAFDHGHLGHGVDRERMLAEDHQVSVFSDINRARSLVYAKLNCRIERYHPLCMRHANIFAEDILCLLAYENYIPRSVLVDYLKTLFAFHLALYHLNLFKLLPELVKRQRSGLICQVKGCALAPAKTSAQADCAYRTGLVIELGVEVWIDLQIEELVRGTRREGGRVAVARHAGAERAGQNGSCAPRAFSRVRRCVRARDTRLRTVPMGTDSSAAASS